MMAKAIPREKAKPTCNRELKPASSLLIVKAATARKEMVESEMKCKQRSDLVNRLSGCPSSHLICRDVALTANTRKDVEEDTNSFRHHFTEPSRTSTLEFELTRRYRLCSDHISADMLLQRFGDTELDLVGVQLFRAVVLIAFQLMK